MIPVLYASHKSKTLESNLNYDLKNLRLVDKSKFILFSSKYHKTVFNISTKLQGIKLLPRDSVKYILANTLPWDYHVTELSKIIFYFIYLFI